MTSAFLTLTKGQGHTTRSKVTDVEVSAFSECFLLYLSSIHAGAAYEYLQSQDRREMLERELKRKSNPAPSNNHATTSGPKPGTSKNPTSSSAYDSFTSKPNYTWNYKVSLKNLKCTIMSLCMKKLVLSRIK